VVHVPVACVRGETLGFRNSYDDDMFVRLQCAVRVNMCCVGVSVGYFWFCSRLF